MTTDFHATTAPETLTVSQLNRRARQLLESHFDFLWVSGEVSNFSAPGSGHWYFTLKDGDAQVRCAMFRNRNQRLRFKPGNGDAIRLRARVSLYEGRGDYQLIVEFIEPAGEGALQLAFERLKVRLQQEGLFDPEAKKPLPSHCRHIGVVTSPTGAALQDMLTVFQRRWPAMEITVFAAPVQGEGAAAAIATAIAQANSMQRSGEISLDALIIGRGGGSLEDLWAFNDEALARTIAASSLPIVSAVGHETDFSIADMVADQRAATPSAAAELLSPDQQQWQTQLENISTALVTQMQRQLASAATQLNYLARRLRHPGHRLREQSQRLDDLDQRLEMALRHQLRHERNRLALLTHRLRACSPENRIHAGQLQLHSLQQRLPLAIQQQLTLERTRLQRLAEVLNSLSPLQILARGFAILSSADGEILRSSEQVSSGDQVNARLARGEIQLRVEAIDPE